VIKVVLVETDVAAILACDRCHTTLLHTIVLETPFVLPTSAQRRVLRNLAQKAGWLHILGIGQEDGPKDLCPRCFTLPPEG
jgi:hypothetical protein